MLNVKNVSKSNIFFTSAIFYTKQVKEVII